MVKHEQYEPTRNADVQPKDFTSSPNVARTDKNFNVKGLFTVNDVNVTNKIGQVFNRTTFSGSVYSTATSDYLIGITSLAIAPTIGLPRPQLVGTGKNYRVKDEAGGSATTTITIVSQGEETIDGASSATITTNYQAKAFYTDGANWFTY